MLKSYKLENGLVVAMSHIDSVLYENVATGSEPFYLNPEESINWQLLNGQWIERVWSQLQVVYVTYDWQRSVCIVSLSNGDVCEFPCQSEWSTLDVVTVLQTLPRYSLTNFE